MLKTSNEAQLTGHSPENLPLSAYADAATRCAVVVSPAAIHVWRYNSTDTNPLTFEFPVDAPHVAIVTCPLPGAADPGLVTVNSVTGAATFYESLHHAPALGLIRAAASETTVPLHLTQGEFIVAAEPAEPAGVVVLTLWHRVFMIVLRDAAGMPRLATVELVGAPRRRLLGLLPPAPDSGAIVAMRRAKVAPSGAWQHIAILTATGTLRTVVVQASVLGVPAATRHSSEVHLAPYLANSVDAVVPGSAPVLRFVDMWPWSHDDMYSVLVEVVDAASSAGGSDAVGRYVLVTMRINSLGVLVEASHRIPAVRGEARLFVPQPGRTAFVVVGHAVVLVDLGVGKGQAQEGGVSNKKESIPGQKENAAVPYYTSRWSDVVRLKSAVHIYGLGYENGSGADHAAVVLITDSGVIRLERFESDDATADPVARVASHMQQAMFYRGAPAVDFDVALDLDGAANLNFDAALAPADSDSVVAAARHVVAATLELASPYLPAYASTLESLAARAVLVRELVMYVRRNFAAAWPAVRPDVVLALEKLDAAQSVWRAVDGAVVSATSSAPPSAPRLKQKLYAVLRLRGITADDPARDFFAHHVADILPVLTELVETDDPAVPSMVVGALRAVVDAERCWGDEPRMLWVFDLRLLILAEELYTKTYGAGAVAPADRALLVDFADALFFLVTYAIRYMTATNDDQLDGYVDWYRRRKGSWVKALLANGLVDEALRITETYSDFYSLAAVLHKERDLRSPEYVDEQVTRLVEKHGYEFAAKLFDYHLKHTEWQELLASPYHAYLEQYFAENPRSTAHVAWIYYVRVRNFAAASALLMVLSSAKDAEDQQSREFNFSLAKLTAIAAGSVSLDGLAPADNLGDSENVASAAVLEETAIEAELSLVVIRVQNWLHQAISAFVLDNMELVTLDYFLDNFANTQVEKDQLRVELDPFFLRFVAQHPLLKEQLILLLTATQPKQPFGRVFADALYVAAQFANDEIFTEQASDVWIKLLTLTDDWSEINNTSANLDDVNKIKLRETMLFTTVREVHSNKEIMAVLDGVMARAQDEAAALSDPESLYAEAHHLVLAHNLELWVDTVKAEVLRE